MSEYLLGVAAAGALGLVSSLALEHGVPVWLVVGALCALGSGVVVRAFFDFDA